MTGTEHEQRLKIESLIREFWNKVAELFRVGNPRGLGLLNFIRQRIRQARLNGWEETELLIEACLRGVEYIEKNCLEIRNPASWLRIVVTNIIKEEVRKNVQNDRVIHDVYIEDSSEEDTSSDNELERALEHLNISLENISSEDRELIELRFFRKLSYKEIQKYLNEKGNSISKLDTLRQKMSRALKRLRKEYKSGSENKNSCI